MASTHTSAVSVRISKDHHEALKKRSESTGASIAWMLDRAITDWLGKWKQPKAYPVNFRKVRP